MVRVCSVRWCKNTSRCVTKGRKIGNVCFFSYPQDEETRALWTQFANSWMTVPGWAPNRYSFICSDHFQNEDICWKTHCVKLNVVPGDIFSSFLTS